MTTDQGVRILIVDDEKAIRRTLRASLASRGYIVTEAATGTEALEKSVSSHSDVIILDLGLPDIDGIEVIGEIRKRAKTPIIILSVRDEIADKVAALDAGADDYLTKPFSVGELMARLRSALRRSAQAETDPVFKTAELVVDLNLREVSVNGELVSLTPTEYDILRTFVKHAGRVLTHDQLLRAVWGTAYESETHMLQVNISNLRRKIEPDPLRPVYLVTEPGVGYRLKII